jgi:hypothetical protein
VKPEAATKEMWVSWGASAGIALLLISAFGGEDFSCPYGGLQGAEVMSNNCQAEAGNNEHTERESPDQMDGHLQKAPGPVVL